MFFHPAVVTEIIVVSDNTVGVTFRVNPFWDSFSPLLHVNDTWKTFHILIYYKSRNLCLCFPRIHVRICQLLVKLILLREIVICMPGLELGGKDIIWVVRVGLQPVCKCKRVMVSKGFRTGYNKTGYTCILSHTMLGRQVTYNNIIFISVDYYM